MSGRISIQGSKNAALPMMAAALLHKGITVLRNVPQIEDVECMLQILEYVGCRCNRRGSILEIDASSLDSTDIPEHFVGRMRSSVILLGALLGRAGHGTLSRPGGCLIGARPIDLHFQMLEGLGAVLEEREGRIYAGLPGKNRLAGADLKLSYPSVGATEQVLLAAVLARGITRLTGAAKEPEISQLCRFLNHMGARISGVGTSCLVIEGVETLHDSSWQVEGDRIVAGTYLCAVMAAGGRAELTGIDSGQLTVPIEYLKAAGAEIHCSPETQVISISMEERPRPLVLETAPYPGFPTDLQSPFMAFLAAGQGISRIREQVFEGRFATAKELKNMGAVITLEDREARIQGQQHLQGAVVKARDLRGGAALVIAGLGALGITLVESCQYIERGYEDICRDLQALGADVKWI